jgi:DNA-binding response OmpR family regulator
MKVLLPFRLDTVNQCLWKRSDPGPEERVLLTLKTFAVLVHLVEHAGRLVTHDELLEAVWPCRVIEPQVVKKHVLAVRGAPLCLVSSFRCRRAPPSHWQTDSEPK